MLHYPKIHPYRRGLVRPCVAFEKLDGTNLHWCWDRHEGWISFGTRRESFSLSMSGTDRFRATHRDLAQAVDVFWATIAEPVERVLRDRASLARFPRVKVFTEFLGPRSFAGTHVASDPKRLVVFDVLADGFGLLSPERFVADFASIETPRVLDRGLLSRAFVQSVRQGHFAVEEGVVCKGISPGGAVWMVKIKTNAYAERLRQASRFPHGEVCWLPAARVPAAAVAGPNGPEGLSW
jgi:hypothetical protein